MSQGIAVVSAGGVESATCAMERLRDALSHYGPTPVARRIVLADVAKPLLTDEPVVVDHGLAGVQAHRVVVDSDTVYLLGHGVAGLGFAVERFRKDILGVDPLAPWTGLPVRPARLPLCPCDIRGVSPAFGHRIYFDNDSDELLWWSSGGLRLEWRHLKLLIDTLFALGYDGFMPMDCLGRSEFRFWEYYTDRYRQQWDASLVERMVDYLHAKGMVFMAQMALAWPARALDPAHACWCRNRERWVDIWRHYLTGTSLGRADIMLASIGDPLWDGDYRCRCDECGSRGAAAIQLEYNRVLIGLVRSLAPQARIALDTYNPLSRQIAETLVDDCEGMAVMEYADHGYGEFAVAPRTEQGVPSATLIHAGYWLDHTVLNPYVARLGQAIEEASKGGARTWLRVNGQSFKPFALMVEAAACAAWEPASFDPDEFVLAWARRRLGSRDRAELFAGFTEHLLELNETVRTGTKERGYVHLLMGHVWPLLLRCARIDAGGDITRPGVKTYDVMACVGDDSSSVEHARAVVACAEDTLTAAGAVLDGGDSAELRAFVDDLVLFPARLFLTASRLYECLARLDLYRTEGRVDQVALDRCEEVLHGLWSLHETGPEHPLWRTWYLPRNQRVFGYPPPPETARLLRTAARQ